MCIPVEVPSNTQLLMATLRTPPDISLPMPTPEAPPRLSKLRAQTALGAAQPHTADITTVLFHRDLPVDVRHNAKIRRGQLAEKMNRKYGGKLG